MSYAVRKMYKFSVCNFNLETLAINTIHNVIFPAIYTGIGVATSWGGGARGVPKSNGTSATKEVRASGNMKEKGRGDRDIIKHMEIVFARKCSQKIILLCTSYNRL